MSQNLYSFELLAACKSIRIKPETVERICILLQSLGDDTLHSSKGRVTALQFAKAYWPNKTNGHSLHKAGLLILKKVHQLGFVKTYTSISSLHPFGIQVFEVDKKNLYFCFPHLEHRP